MQVERNFFEYLSYQIKHGGATIHLILVNSSIFVVIKLLEVVGRLLKESEVIMDFIISCFSLRTTIGDFLTHPWGLITSCFAHFSVWHFFMNMIFLYYSGKMFESFFDNRRLYATYVLGGIFGGLFELFAHAIFPSLVYEELLVVGASGSIMAIFSALAFYRPQMNVLVFGIFPVRLILLAGFFILADLFSLGLKDNVAHFAHIGGVILGILSIQRLGSKTNIISSILIIMDKVIGFFKRLFGSRGKLKLVRGKQTRTNRFKSDEEYNLEAKIKQERLDAILDKISKSGYESLTKEEKKFLFNQSQK